MFSINHWGIRKRVLFLAIVPLLVLTSIVTIYSISSRVAEVEHFFAQRGTALVSAYSGSAEFGLFAGNLDVLATLTRNALSEQDVIGISISDADGHALITEGNVPYPDNIETWHTANLSRYSDYWVFHAPVVSLGIDINDFPEDENRDDLTTVVGHVVLILSPERIEAIQTSLIVNTLVITAIGLCLIIWMAIRFGKSIVDPLREVVNVVSLLENDELQTRVKLHLRGGDLGRLQQGINALAESVEVSRKTLERRVADATEVFREALTAMEAQNIELQQAREREQQANVAKDDFLARMSHELRTPLTSVIGYAHLLSSTKLDSHQIEHIRVIEHASKLLLSVINDVLDYSKIQSRALTLEHLSFDLFSTADNVISMLKQNAVEKGLDIEYEYEHDLPHYFVGDAARISQVLTNLISNAIKFTEQGSVCLRISNQSKSTLPGQLVIEIVDTGIGISKLDQGKLFDAFAQADSSISRRFGGTGLGLVISRQIVELMGGHIQLESTPGEGTRVVCHILLDVSKSSGTNEQDLAVGHGSDVNVFSELSVLLVEDNDLNRHYFSELLNLARMKVHAAANSDAALLLIQENDIDVVLMDVHLPGTDGIQTTKKIRQLSGPVSQTPVLALTANLIGNEKQQLTDVGVETILYKPLEEEKLFSTIAQVCGLKYETNSAIKPIFVSPELYQQVLLEVQSQLEHIRHSCIEEIHSELVEQTHIVRGLVGLYKIPDMLNEASILDKSAIDKDLNKVLVYVDRLLAKIESNKTKPV